MYPVPTSTAPSAWSSCRGQTTIAMAGIVALIAVLGIAVATIADAMVHRAQARTAADAVALASVMDAGTADELQRWYQERGFEVDYREGRAHSRSGPAQAVAWAGVDGDGEQPAPALVAIIARAEQLTGTRFASPRLRGTVVEVSIEDSVKLRGVAADLGLCEVAVSEASPGVDTFALC